jgi:hypothetical protein
MKPFSYLPISATALAFVALSAFTADAADWIFAPSTYSHDPESGQRIAQYAPIPPVYTAPRSGYVESGYRHFRSSIRGAYGSADHLHLVEEWGRPVRPYGEWQYPYRPGSVPYSLWGPPYAGMYNNWWGYPWWGPFRGGAGPGGSGGGPGGPGGGPGSPGGGFPGWPGGPGGPGGGPGGP